MYKVQSGLYDGIRGRDRTVEGRFIPSSSTEQDRESNQHFKKVKENVSSGLNDRTHC